MTIGEHQTPDRIPNSGRSILDSQVPNHRAVDRVTPRADRLPVIRDRPIRAGRILPIHAGRILEISKEEIPELSHPVPNPIPSGPSRRERTRPGQNPDGQIHLPHHGLSLLVSRN